MPVYRVYVPLNEETCSHNHRTLGAARDCRDNPVNRRTRRRRLGWWNLTGVFIASDDGGVTWRKATSAEMTTLPS